MNILVSACLLGQPCRYDGQSKPCAAVQKLIRRHHLVPVCPEQLGGLSTPRPPAELRRGRVVTKDEMDVTDAYTRGAREALMLAQVFSCKHAILKARSPSCGCGEVYDGTFSGTLTPGNGVCAALLKSQGVEIYTEDEVEKLEE